MSEAVNTKTVSEFRSHRFASIDECIAEIHRIVEADAKGELRVVGNWSPGQVMAHLASWIEYGYDGYPIGAPPFFIRWFLKLGVKKMLRDGMPRGVRIPGVKEGTVGMDEMETPAAAERLIAAFKRLQDGEEAKFHSPAFGAMSHADRIELNLRHAELHFGFLNY